MIMIITTSWTTSTTSARAFRPTMMIDDGDPVAADEQVLGFHLIRPVGVHYDQQGPAVSHDDGFLLPYEDLRILRKTLQPLDHRHGDGRILVDDDAGGFSKLPGDAADARRRADAV